MAIITLTILGQDIFSDMDAKDKVLFEAMSMPKEKGFLHNAQI